MFSSFYNIAGVRVRLDSEDEITDEVALFFAAPPTDEHDFSIRENRYGKLGIPGDYTMTYDQKGEVHFFTAPTGELIVQLGLRESSEQRDGRYQLRFNQEMSSVELYNSPYHSDQLISGLLGRFIYECHIMHRGWLPLHAVSVDTGDGALLFSGTSGSGKTTQADLWMKHAGARFINGDRALLIPSNGGFDTAGSPWNGASGKYTNLRARVKAIVFIEQAATNEIEKLDSLDAFGRLVDLCVTPYYHSGLLCTVMDTIDSLISQVPMYHLKNKADEESFRITKELIAVQETPLGNGF